MKSEQNKDFTLINPVHIEDDQILDVGNGDDSCMKVIKEIMIVGAGTSTCVPNIACLTAPNPTCKVCFDAEGLLEREASFTAMNGGPPPGCPSRNKRSNPSACLRYQRSDGSLGAILIDCGKTFYGGACRQLVRWGVRELDAVVLTHGHADAIGGLDDLRHWAGHIPCIQKNVTIYCDQETFNVVQSTFPYLVDSGLATGGGEVGQLKFVIFEAFKAFRIDGLNSNVCDNSDYDKVKVSTQTCNYGGLEIIPLPLEHGKRADKSVFYANGFHIDNLLYLSDLSAIPPNTRSYIEERKGNFCMVVIDCLFEERSYPSHIGWPDTKKILEWLRLECSVLVGMAHSIDYYGFQRKLDADCGVPIAPDGIIGKLCHVFGRFYVGFDGMVIRFFNRKNK